MLTVYATEESEIYGRGKRLVIWVSGCTLKGKGCSNSHLWNKSSGREYTVEELFRAVKRHNGLKGVTYIGGEPLQQGEELLELSKKIVEAGLDIVLFTGYELNELNSLQKSIAEAAVVIISGMYVESLRDTGLLLRGSSNQKITVKEEELKKFYSEELRQVEIVISATEDKLLGFPEDFLD